jgi:YcaO-like protein with predicted kinase domain
MKKHIEFEKPYKEDFPKNTILKIRKILSRIDIFTTAVIWNNPYNKIYSVRIEAIEDDGSFGTNGKGRNQIYALASAYAEFIERLQNLFISGSTGFAKIFLDNIKNKTGFFFFPDEKVLVKESFYNLPDNILLDFFPNQNSITIKNSIDYVYKRLSKENREGLVSVPFYDMSKDKLTFLPQNFLLAVTGSNGMAAGNTIAEATFQALCELYERNAASIIYYNRLTPPTIDIDFLKKYPEEYGIIEEIERQGYILQVKDFSCGLKLPVIGLILIDEKEKKYRLNIGSDTNFKIALNRVLTEIFQGVNQDNLKKSLLNYPNEKDTPYFFNSQSNEEDEEQNFKNYVQNGSGVFPPSIFKNKSSYEFNNTVFTPSNSYERDVEYLLKLAKKLNYDVYLRDVSFLNFPSVYIYIPNVSKFGNKSFSKANENDLIIFDDLEKILFPFNKFIFDKLKIKNAISIIEKIHTIDSSCFDNELKRLFKLNFKKGTTWSNLTVDFFLILLSFLDKDYAKSIFYLEKFINKRNLQQIEYYQEVLKYFSNMRDGVLNNNIRFDIIENFKTPINLFSKIHFPNCPDCSSCRLNQDCLTKINIKNTISINEEFKNSIINQYKFNIFSKH